MSFRRLTALPAAAAAVCAVSGLVAAAPAAASNGLAAGHGAAAATAAPGQVAAGPGAAAGRAAAHARAFPAPAWPNFDVSARPGNEAENTIAANPADPLNVVAMTCLNGRVNWEGLFLGVSFDGGVTWARRLFATGAAVGHTCDERLAWDRYGNLWMTHLEATGPVFVGLSTDGGLRFRKVADILPPSPFGQHVADRPSVSVGPHSVWVSYTNVLSEPQARVEASGAKVTGLGRFGAFSPPEGVPARHGHGDFGGIAVGPRGQVLVIYENIASQRRSRIYTALDPDGLGPKGFGRPRLLARTHVNATFRIPAQPGSITTDASLAWDTGGGRYHGRVYAVWTQAPLHSSNTNIMFQYSRDNGNTWTKPVRLNDDHTANSQFFPAIAVDQATGDVAASWYDCRNDRGQGGPGDPDRIPNNDTQTWATYSANGGATFTPDFRVSQGTTSAKDAGSFFGDYTQAAFQSHLFYPAWTDNSDSTGTNPDGRLHQMDLYTARVPIP
jgi:hypothetical protein